MSTFQGLELAKKALYAQQGALYTTGHNIANVNTTGYSRQRVNFETTSPFPMPSRVMPTIAGQIGTGVEIGTVERVRDQFLDKQFRAENSRANYWSTKSEALSRMEEVLNEPSEDGLSAQMDLLWQALQDLADHPDNDGARSVAAQRALALTETFNHLSKSLQAIQGDLKEQIDVSTKNINSLLSQINGLNEQIQKIEPHGMLANDLYDERDRLMDQLSNYMNIKVDYTKSSDSSLQIADGLASIQLIDRSGQSFDPPIYLIDARDRDNVIVNEFELAYNDADNAEKGLVSTITVDGVDVLQNILSSEGTLSGLLESYGVVGGGENNLYPNMLNELNKMAKQFAEAFNTQHQAGIDANGEPGKAFFVTKDGSTDITAENITVLGEIVKDPTLIAASAVNGGSRNGDNALDLAKVFDKDIEGLDDTSVRKYFIALIGDLGVKGQKANTMKNSTDILKSQIENSRMSVTAVSLDEEISNLIKFQHAYNAAARSMTAIDELIDRVINQMGIVGR
ncbi:flagellar hook-associated protein FlgK [Pseudogracilibacillus sp. ICA-222130]|uniref:flagellar hook-associated protein FlgK n=1 Tax=Pseudogracilibacillus sp. ICA-222130 TaxID=3134655 RepID=UPI0030C4EF77